LNVLLVSAAGVEWMDGMRELKMEGREPGALLRRLARNRIYGAATHVQPAFAAHARWPLLPRHPPSRSARRGTLIHTPKNNQPTHG